MTFDQEHKVSEPLAIINTLVIAAMEAPNRQALEFIITNDTRKLLKYDRAILFGISKNTISILSISGQSSIYSLTEFYKKINDLAGALIDSSSIQLLSADSFSKKQEIWAEYQRQHSGSILWLPIFSKGELSLGLWIEQWDVAEQQKLSEQSISLLSQYLLPGYGAALGKFKTKFRLKGKSSQKAKYIIPVIAALVSLLFIIHIPLRIIASCEVVPKDPTIITAPLQGVIEKIDVKPGEQVTIGTVLVEYDKRLFDQDLKIAENDYATSEAALDRALSLGVENQESLNDVAILKLKMQKQKIDLELAKENYKKIHIKSPVKGSVLIDDIDQWIGKPVQIGEKIMTVADLTKTKVKIWIPENDNIKFDKDIPVQVVLNVNPENNRKAKLVYMGNEIIISDQQVPSFLAEAEWEDSNADVKSGLKGTAVIYGEKVSLAYYLVRKPWIVLRKVFGM